MVGAHSSLLSPEDLIFRWLKRPQPSQAFRKSSAQLKPTLAAVIFAFIISLKQWFDYGDRKRASYRQRGKKS